MYRRIGKRALDLLLVVPSLVLLAPVMAIISLLIRIDSAGSVFFVQERLGRGGRTFRAYKFRTMVDRQRTEHREIFGKTDEVTKLGYWLRRLKLDEVPQLLNVLK